MRRQRLVLSMGTTLAVLSAPALSYAQVGAAPSAPEAPVPSEDERQLARDEFGQGKSAFASGDYLRAASLFLSAYRHAPHHDALWNAARALELAGEKARAANLYARYLAIAPAEARDRDRATASRKDLSVSLGRIDIHGHASNLRIDDVPVDGTSVYVDPGQHLIRGRVDDVEVERVESVQAGAVASVVLEAPALRAAPALAPTPPPVVTEQGRKPLSPVFFFVGLGLTTVAGGLTIASGVDTLNSENSFQMLQTKPNLEDGQYKESRTNVLFWSTLGVAAVTAVVAIFLVDWRHPHSAPRVVMGTGSPMVGGGF